MVAAGFLILAMIACRSESVSPDRLIFVGYQTGIMLRLDEPQIGFVEFPCGRYRAISTGRSLWIFTGENFGAEFGWTARMYGLNAGERVWVVRAGWNEFSSGREVNLRAELAKQFSDVNCLPYHDFGANISVFQVTIPSGSSPPTRTGVC